MATTLEYNRIFEEETWGSTFSEVINVADTGNVFICHASVTDLEKVAEELANRVNDRSWVVGLDNRYQRAYETTASKTAQKLVAVFKADLTSDSKIVKEFGELMVSMGSAKALEVIFEHRSLPIAELWKPKLSQNEGFDFHTICKEDVINFGEAKFSSSSSPHSGETGESSGAGGQADGFIGNEKHLMDGPHLGPLAGETAATNLDNDLFGIVLGFSINANDPLLILKNALENVKTYENLKKAKTIYIVGVSYDTTD